MRCYGPVRPLIKGKWCMHHCGGSANFSCRIGVGIVTKVGKSATPWKPVKDPYVLMVVQSF
jgi:hypothetical protein